VWLQSNAEIQEFVSEMYHVNFPVFAKVDVLGEDASEAWRYLICKLVKIKPFPPYIYAFMAYANTVDPDQPAHLCHLIRICTVCLLIY
jgi:hypothetical protein